MNIAQRAVVWLQKAIGFPPWNVVTPAPQLYSQFFRGINGADTLNRLPTVYTCCNLLSRVVSTLPIDIVESDGEISRPVSNYIGGLLKQPNEYMNKVSFMETMLLNLCLHGNAFAEIVRIGNRITSLWPLPFERVSIKWENHVLWYEVALPDGSIARLAARNVLHLKNFSLDGIIGLSPLMLHVIRNNMGAHEFQSNFFKNGARPSIAFVSPDKPNAEAQDRLRETAERLYAGPENAGRMMFLFGGMDVKTISVSPEDAQLIESLKLGIADISAAFGVPLNLLNQTDKTATYASAVEFNRYWVDYSLGPLCNRVATALTEALLNPRLSVSVKFNLDGLLVGNSESRINYLRTAVAAGLMTPNEARAKLNLPPMAGGDNLVIQSNMTPLDSLEELAIERSRPQVTTPNGNGATNGDGNAGAKAKRYLPAWR